jgi:nucleotide-binding universal stress UspA family protein
MNPFERIIVAIDGSPHSDHAVSHAKTMAEKFGSTLFLVHAFPHTSDLIGYEEYEKLVTRRELAGQALLDRARAKLGESIPHVQEELLEGPPAEAILTVAEQRRADLIVMGTRGLGDLKGLLLGSVSHKVLQSAHCPILAVR